MLTFGSFLTSGLWALNLKKEKNMEENQELRNKLNRINNKIGKTLYRYRKNKGIGQKEFGDIIGVSGTRIKKSEFRPKKLEISLFFLLCKNLDVDINKLIAEIYSII